MRFSPHTRAVWLVCLLLALACPVAAQVPLQPVRYPIVDCHLHYLDFLQRTDGMPALLAAMDRCGVEQAMISGMPLVKQWEEGQERQPQYYLEDDARCYWYSATDVEVARAVSSLTGAARRRFHPFICGFNGADRNAVDHVRKMIAWYPGLWEGIGEVMTRHDDLTALTYGPTAHADSNALDPVYDLAAEYDLPVSVHSDIGSVWLRDPLYEPEIERAVRKHPNTRFIWCHAGISRRIVVPTLTAELRRLLTAYPNLSVDVSWVVFEEYLDPLDAKTGQRHVSQDWVSLIEAFPTRFLIGSDKVGRFANYHEEIQKYYVFLDALKPDTARRLARDNFLALLPKQPATLKPAAPTTAQPAPAPPVK